MREEVDGSIWYATTEGVIVEFTYWPEDSPWYVPTVNIGVLRDSIFHGVGLWALLPEGVRDLEYYRWRFSDAVQLRRAFERIRDEILAVFIDPILSKPEVILAAASKHMPPF
jgi:hypothetical protein